MKFRTKPIQVDAFQFTEEMALSNLVDGVPLPFLELRAGGTFDKEKRKIYHTNIVIDLMNFGPSVAEIGDWIVRDSKGEYCVYGPSYFEKTYERIN